MAVCGTILGSAGANGRADTGAGIGIATDDEGLVGIRVRETSINASVMVAPKASAEGSVTDGLGVRLEDLGTAFAVDRAARPDRDGAKGGKAERELSRAGKSSVGGTDRAEF